MTTAECPGTGLGSVSDLLEVLVAKYAKRRDAVGHVCESARQRILWLRQPIPEGFHSQTAAARDFDEAYPLAGVYNPKWTPHLLRILVEAA